jgi:hypothetical protein
MKKKNKGLKKVPSAYETPLHKMDDQGRRDFIRNIGFFLGAIAVPSIIRFETMEKISKRIFGSSVAYAQSSGYDTAVIEFNIRAGYKPAWIVGNATDHQVTSPSRNVPWANNTMNPTNPDAGNPNDPYTTSYVPLNLPTHSEVLSPYKNAIQMCDVFQNVTGHTNLPRMSVSMGQGNILTWRAATEIEAGASPILNTPVGFFDLDSYALQNVPNSLVDYAPQAYSSIQAFYSQFAEVVLRSHQNTALSINMRNSVFDALQNQFSSDVTKLMRYSKFVDSTKAASESAFSALRLNLANELNPDSGANAAKLTAITMGDGGLNPLPGGNNRLGAGVDIAKGIVALLNGMSLGVFPLSGVIGCNSGDWHSRPLSFQNSGQGAAAGTDQALSGAYMAAVLRNTMDAINAGLWVHPTTGDPLKLISYITSEFARTRTVQNDNTDNGDGGEMTTFFVHSQTNQSVFKPGSIGGTNGNGAHLGFNPANMQHAASTAKFTADQCLGHMAKVLGVNLTDFGVDVDHIPGLLA